MARFLVSTDIFVDLARAKDTPSRRWLAKAWQERGISDIDLAASVMSLVRLERNFQDLERQNALDAKKIALRTRCNAYAQELRHRQAILPFGDDKLPVWAQIQRLCPDLDAEAFVYATAIVERLTLLDHPRVIHTQLLPLGLVVEDPGGP